VTTHLQLVPRSRKYESIRPLPTRLHDVVLNYLSTGTTLLLLSPFAISRYDTELFLLRPGTLTPTAQFLSDAHGLNFRVSQTHLFNSRAADSFIHA
jgi:hypothetical protein